MIVYKKSIDVLRMSRGLVKSIEKRDRDLARQLKRAGSSVSLNIAEGRNGRGGNSRLRYETALQSARECRACFDVAAALGYLEDERCTEVHDAYDQIAAMLYRMTRG